MWELPKHSLGLPKFILHGRDELSPNKEIQHGYVDYVNDKDRPVLYVFHVKATNREIKNE